MIKTSTIKFLHDNELVEIDFSKNQEITPTTTVLQYLRKTPNYKGTKEGCAEGDCGACTVTIAEMNGRELKYRAVNSCLIFLPSLHGKQLITIENMGNSKDLHPIQSAMLETDASQCGYCTPGFVMSMLPLYKQKTIPKKEDIQIALAGNLCRCTGYRPIIEAANRVAGKNEPDKFTENEKIAFKTLEEINNSKELIEIQNNNTQYYLPILTETALKLRKEQPEAILINGSTDIALRVTKKFEHLSNLIDLSQIRELNFVRKTEKSATIGTGVKLEDIKDEFESDFPALIKMLTVFGSRQIRNVATLGGNIGSASPISDSLPILMAYDAKINLQSLSAERQIPLREFITDYRKTQLKDSELITSVEIPIPAKKKIIEFYKISKRKDLDISTVSVAFELELDKDKKVNLFKAFYGGMAATTREAENIQNFLIGKKWTEANVLKAGELISKDFTPLSDARSGAEARLIMAKNLLTKFYSENLM